MIKLDKLKYEEPYKHESNLEGMKDLAQQTFEIESFICQLDNPNNLSNILERKRTVHLNIDSLSDRGLDFEDVVHCTENNDNSISDTLSKFGKNDQPLRKKPSLFSKKAKPKVVAVKP